MFPLLSSVQKALSKHDSIKIGNRLTDLGLEETYARLIVNNMKKHAPTLQYHLGQLNQISDDGFIDNIDRIMNSIWIDHEKAGKVVERYDINHDQYTSIVEVSSNMIINLLRGNVAEKRVMMTFTEHGLSKRKSEAFLKSIGSHKENWQNTVMFSNVQDALLAVEELKEQNKEIIKNIQNVLDLLKTQRSNNERTI